jgi:23S rRNA-/tRNA-specific pseudouridylate synthase
MTSCSPDPSPPPQPRVLSVEEDLIVLDKPSGWTTHAATADETRCLTLWARTTLDQPDLSPLHRLDRPTSGVILFSAHPHVRGETGKLFAEGLIQKAYVALVHGRTNRKGIIRKALADARRSADLDAVTRFRRTELLGGFSLLEVRPEHGRRHQIRRHLTAIGHPIVGDDRWGRPRQRVPGYPGRLWLHATRLCLPDGRIFDASLATELQTHIELLREPRPLPTA